MLGPNINTSFRELFLDASPSFDGDGDPLTFQWRSVDGRGEVVTDEKMRQRIYDQAIESERRADAQMKGGAVLVHLNALEGVAPSGRVNMRAGGA